MQALDFRSINVANFHASSSYGKICILYGNEPFKMNSPALKAPFGLSEFTNYGNKTYSLNLSFHDEFDNDVVTMKDFMTSLDLIIIELAVKNSVQWFKKQLTRADVVKMYRPLCKPSNNPAYPPTFRVKLKQKAGAVLTETVHSERPSCTFADIEKGCFVEVVMSISPIWIVNDAFGVSMIADRIQIKDKVQTSYVARNIDFIEDN
jgi:hypothetical protein